MVSLKNLFIKWREKKYIHNLRIVFILFIMGFLGFFLGSIKGQPNLIIFIVVTMICFLIIILFLARHLYAGFVVMFISGVLGYLCDMWGVGNNFWLYNKNTISLLILNGGNLMDGGFPIEIVLAYFASGMLWIYVIEFLFGKEIKEIVEEYNGGKKLVKNFKQLIFAFVITLISWVIIFIAPLSYLQPLVYFSIGIIAISWIPKGKRIIPVLSGIILGFIGFFIEVFCSGKIFPEIQIWTYQNVEWLAFSIPPPFIFGVPISAFFAYFGVGAFLVCTFLLILKIPVFQKEINLYKKIKLMLTNW